MRHNETKRGALSVELRDNTDINRALKIFNKKVQDEGILKEVRDRMEYEKPTTIRKRKKKTAVKRWEKYVQEMISSGQLKGNS